MYKGYKISGDAIGRKLGFPTVNLQLSQSEKTELFLLFPKGGVFLVSVFIKKKYFNGLLHLGQRPTFSSKDWRVEIFLFHFFQEIPDNTEVVFSIEKKIRDVKKFSSVEALISQIEKDKKFVLRYLK